MKYPYYIVPEIEEYQYLDPNSVKARKLRRIIYVNIGDREVLKNLLGDDSDESNGKYDSVYSSQDSSMATIDSFLSKFGGKLGPLGYMAEEEKISSQGDALVKEEAKKEINSLGELIKEGRIKEAIQLIERQKLINPEKSIYFAHQMSFLRKLEAIENYRKQTKG